MFCGFQLKTYQRLLKENVIRSLNFLKYVQDDIKELYITPIKEVIKTHAPRVWMFDKTFQ